MTQRRVLTPYPPAQPAACRPGPLAQGKPAQIRAALQSGRWDTAVRLAMGTGVTGADQLADAFFYLLHPQLRGKRIEPSQRDLAQEWIEIRDRVRPVLGSRSRPPAGAPSQPGSMRTSFGVDTASVDGNGKADWMRARAQVPLDFAIIRASGGSVPDRVFPSDWPRLKDAGIVRGAYLFLSFPGPHGRPPSPVAQAKAFIGTAGKLGEGELPPALDVEFPGEGRKETGMTARQLLDGVRDAWEILRDHYGVAPLIYTSARVWNEDLSNLPAPDLAESPLWVKYYPYGKGPARYGPQTFAGGRSNPPVPPPWGDAANWWIHQYQGDAVRLPGFSGTVDMNRFNVMIRGATGDRVRWVQRRLGTSQSGAFDAATERALRAFQNKKGISADGVIDPRTFAFLCWSTPTSVWPSN